MNKFQHALGNGNIRTVRRMLRQNPTLAHEITEDGFTMLMLAVMSSERTGALVNALLGAGAEVNIKTPEDYTALHCCIDVNGPTKWGRIAMKIIRLLVDAGADLEIRNHYGWTPLMQAVVEGSSDQVKAFLEAGANPNVTFPEYSEPIFLRGYTVLMLAVSREDNLRLLLKAGADITAKDEHGQTVLEHAKAQLTGSLQEGYQAKLLRGIALLERAAVEFGAASERLWFGR